MFIKKSPLLMLAITALYFSACKPKNTGTAVSGDAASKVYVAPGKYDEFYNFVSVANWQFMDFQAVVYFV